MRKNTLLHIGRIFLTSLVGLPLLVGIPTASEADTSLTFGTNSPTPATGPQCFTNLSDTGTGFVFTGCVTPADSPSLWSLDLSGTITNPGVVTKTITITFSSNDYASRPFDTSYFDALSAAGFFATSAGVPNGAGASFTLSATAANNTTLAMMFSNPGPSSSPSSFPPPDAATGSGPCGFVGEGGFVFACNPTFDATLSLTLPGQRHVTFPGSFRVSQQPRCGQNDEDNGNGRVADENGNNGGDFDDNECDENHHLAHNDPDHNMSFRASTHRPVTFSIDTIRGPVATSVGLGIANGKPVTYVLVQAGGLPGFNFYSLTLSDASGVIYQRSGTVYGTINVRH
jgi:hypothetical protein